MNYHRRTVGLSGALAIAACLLLTGCAPERAGADRKAGAPGFELGATDQNLHWAEQGNLKNQLAHIDALADAGAKWVRLSLRQPFAPLLLEHIKRANERGVKVLAVLESENPRLYPPGTKKRPGNFGHGGCAWDSYPLSELDLALSAAFVRQFFELLKAEHATVSAIEMFNEINWNAFNGDLPLVAGGLWIDDSTPWDDPVLVKYRAGVEKVSQLTKAVSDLNRELLGGKVKIITAGQVGFYDKKSNPKAAAWMARAKGALVSHALTLRLMQGTDSRQVGATDYLKFADGIGIHVYPEAGVSNLLEVIERHLDPARRISDTGPAQPFWITESGYVRKKFSSENARLDEFKRFCDVLGHYDRAKGDIAAVLFYNFSSNGGDSDYYALWENWALLPAGRIFKCRPH